MSLSVGINFHIGDDSPGGDPQNDAEKFFYNFGPNRLEELLQEEADESIRAFVGQVRVSKIRDVKTELTSTVKKTLYDKFMIYGVYIE